MSGVHLQPGGWSQTTEWLHHLPAGGPQVCHLPRITPSASLTGSALGLLQEVAQALQVTDASWGRRSRLAPEAHALGPGVPGGGTSLGERGTALPTRAGGVWPRRQQPRSQNHGFSPVLEPRAPFRFLRVCVDLLTPRKYTHTARAHNFRLPDVPQTRLQTALGVGGFQLRLPVKQGPLPPLPLLEWLNLPGGGQANHQQDW